VLLGSGREDVNEKASDHSTPLHLAAAYRREDEAARHLGKGANVEAQNNDGSIPLHYAAFNGNKAIINRLIRKKKKLVDAQNSHELTPLYLAYHYNQTQIASHLTKRHCANVNLKLTENKSLLHVAAKNGHRKAVVNLIEQGLNVNA